MRTRAEATSPRSRGHRAQDVVASRVGAADARLGKLVEEGLGRLTRIAAQTEDDAQRLRKLGAREVAVTGNLKFDVTPPPGITIGER